MSLLTKLRIWNIRRKLTPEQQESFDKKLVITQLRAELALWGIDTSNMTDEEIEAGVVRTAEILSSFGVSAQQAAENLAATIRSIA